MPVRNLSIAAAAMVWVNLLFAATPLFAGDVAQKRVLGFSPDGAYFAFEQSGVMDGSGFPYAEIFVIDTVKDAWMPGTPIRKVIENERAKRTDAVKAARAEAQGLLADLKIGAKGQVLASSARGSQRLTIRRRASPKPLVLTLSEDPLPSKECARFTDQPVMGFTLGLEMPEAKIVLHRDNTLPESRGCALRYAIAEVIRHQAGPRETYAVMIRMQKHGFEGPDTRYLAVTRRLP